MLKTNTFNLPSKIVPMQPQTLFFDVGFTPKNALILKDKVATLQYPNEINAILTKKKIGFKDFFSLYQFILPHDHNFRENLNELGYSPYNFGLLVTDLGIDKKELADLLGWSFSKVCANSTPRNNTHFRPMHHEQWVNFINYYLKVYHQSNGDDKNDNSLFYMKANPSLPLLIP